MISLYQFMEVTGASARGSESHMPAMYTNISMDVVIHLSVETYQQIPARICRYTKVPVAHLPVYLFWSEGFEMSCSTVQET